MDAGTATLLHFVPSDNIGEWDGPSTGLLLFLTPRQSGMERLGGTCCCLGMVEYSSVEKWTALQTAWEQGQLKMCTWPWNTGSSAQAEGPTPVKTAPVSDTGLHWFVLVSALSLFPDWTCAHRWYGCRCWATCRTRLGLVAADRRHQCSFSTPRLDTELGLLLCVSCMLKSTCQMLNAAYFISPRSKLENHSLWNKSMKLDT